MEICFAERAGVRLIILTLSTLSIACLPSVDQPGQTPAADLDQMAGSTDRDQDPSLEPERTPVSGFDKVCIRNLADGTAQLVMCRPDPDCGAGTFLAENNECLPFADDQTGAAMACAVDSDCAALEGHICDADRCIPEPFGCIDDADCPEDDFHCDMPVGQCVNFMTGETMPPRRGPDDGNGDDGNGDDGNGDDGNGDDGNGDDGNGDDGNGDDGNGDDGTEPDNNRPQPRGGALEATIARLQVSRWNEANDRYEIVNRRGNIVLKTSNLLELDGLSFGDAPCDANGLSVTNTQIQILRYGELIADFPQIPIVQAGCRPTDGIKFEWMLGILGKNTDHIDAGPAELVIINGYGIKSIPLQVCLVEYADDECRAAAVGIVGDDGTGLDSAGNPTGNPDDTVTGTVSDSNDNLNPDGTVSQPFPFPRFQISGSTVAIDSERSLMITDLSVVEDPSRTFDGCSPSPLAVGAGGAWTFGKLMRDMAPDMAPGGPGGAQNMVANWLASWEVDQTINGNTAPFRGNVRSRVIDPWQARSLPGQLDLNRAPFRLLAIVNRIDLRSKIPQSVIDSNHPDDIVLASHGLDNTAGEGRLVFGVLDTNCQQMPFTVIFEYALPARTFGDVLRWGERWAELSALDFGPLYNAKLEALVDQYAGRDVMFERPNGNALNQLRTNEIALGAPWELRQFELNAQTGMLEPAAMTNTPDAALNGSTELFLMTLNAASGQSVPASRFAASSPINFIWDSPDFPSSDARHTFAVNTCSGCHSSETGTSFVHVAPRDMGSKTALSSFLTGGDVIDPVTRQEVRSFNDLGRRKTDLEQLLSPFR
jgi:hypothetical protein